MKTLEEKMNNPKEPEVKVLKRQMGNNFPAGRMLIATPKTVASEIRLIRKGKVKTIAQIRGQLAKKYKADYTCPITTGIFLRIVAEHAEQQRSRGVKRIAPYWRVVQRDYSLNPKLPGGIRAQAKRLRADGVKLEQRGSNFKVGE